MLEPEKEERIASKEEAINWLRNWYKKIDLPTINQNEDFEKKDYFMNLLEDTYELEISSGFVIKWFAVRIDPN